MNRNVWFQYKKPTILKCTKQLKKIKRYRYVMKKYTINTNKMPKITEIYNELQQTFDNS